MRKVVSHRILAKVAGQKQKARRLLELCTYLGLLNRQIERMMPLLERRMVNG